MTTSRRARGPGRVNLIGDHTDYNLGLALPMAIDLGTTVELVPDDTTRLRFFSAALASTIDLPVDLPPDPTVLSALQPPWARLVGAVIALARPASGGQGRIDSTVPVGAGLSSSAALAVALTELLGVEGPPSVIARLCQQAEELAGTPVGILDPLTCAGARSGHALLIDFATLATDHVPLPDDVEVVVVDSGERRILRDTPYGARVAECEAAATVTGPLGLAGRADVEGIRDPQLRRRARHVVTECERVRRTAAAFVSDDPVEAGALMTESHRSLAEDFEVSTPTLDALVDHLVSLPGTYGARLTGAGFGGCAVALCRPGAVDLDSLDGSAWRVSAVDGTAAQSVHREPG